MRRGLAITSVIIAVVLLLWFAVAMLPRGFSDDLTRIGQGRHVAVLVHDKDAIESVQLMSMVDSLRGEYEGRIEFVLADVNARSGLEFAHRHSAKLAQLILFGPDGEKLKVIEKSRDATTLRRALDPLVPPQ